MTTEEKNLFWGVVFFIFKENIYMWLIRLVAQDAGLSRRKHGFDSRMSYHNIYMDLDLFDVSLYYFEWKYSPHIIHISE